MSEKNHYSVEYIAPGLVLERLADRTLHIFNIVNGSSVILDAWLNQVKSVLENWPPQKNCLLLHDFHKVGKISLNISLYERFAALYQFRPDLKRYSAIVISDNSIEETQLRIALQKLRLPPSYQAQWQVFSLRLEAMRWLLEQENVFRQEISS